MADGKEGVEVLRRALPLISDVAGGVAMVTDGEGCCLHAVDFDGDPRPDLIGQVNATCRDAAAKGKPIGAVSGEFNHRFFAIPIGGCVLAASNERRADRQSRLFETLKETLPLIATVAGGEAVLFDHGGRRLLAANPRMKEASPGTGEVSESCLKVMRSGKPDISPSTTEIGATAVRIPICAAFGFGFNNAESIRQRAKLLSQVRRERAAKYSWDDVVGIAGALRAPFDAARRAAATRSPVIIYGESGTGKELFAQAIHNSSPRADKPFVAINCAALPETLVETTFFGYLEGAFTGARRGGQKGLFEQADGGTLLLDEVSEMPLEFQAKLLRTLQEREVTPIGGARPVAVDVRVICTSNRDLAQCVADGTWRPDLFYRLNVVDIHLPPLRAHKEDIPVLVEAIRAKLSDRDGRTLAPIPAPVVESLKGYDWPGNARELQNVLDRAYNLAGDEPIAIPHLPVFLAARAQAAPAGASGEADTRLSTLLSATERQLLLGTLERCNGNRTRAAKELGISVTTLWRRLRKIERAGGRPAPH